jgi:hypothetical protein
MVEVVERLLSKRKALSSIHSIAKNKNKIKVISSKKLLITIIQNLLKQSLIGLK